MLSLKRIKQDDLQTAYHKVQADSSPFASSRQLGRQFSRNLNQTNTERLLLPSCPDKPNIYLTSDTQASSPPHKITHYPSLFSLPSNRIIFRSTTGVSMKETNISFSYTSPPKLHKHQSCEPRFSTKKFKTERFPQIGRTDDCGSPVKRIVRSKQSHPHMIYTQETTPDKHKILKPKPEKEKTKLTFFEREGKQNCQQSINQPTPHINTAKNKEDSKQHVPTNDRWTKPERQTKKQYVSRQTNKKNTPTSIEFIKISEKAGSRRQIKATLAPPTFEQIVQAPSDKISNKKYPTLESIQVYEPVRQPGHNRHPNGNNSPKEGLTSIRLMLEQSARQPEFTEIRGSSEDIFLAQSISLELELNYDYCFALDSSDKSLSLHVSL